MSLPTESAWSSPPSMLLTGSAALHQESNPQGPSSVNPSGLQYATISHRNRSGRFWAILTTRNGEEFFLDQKPHNQSFGRNHTASFIPTDNWTATPLGQRRIASQATQLNSKLPISEAPFVRGKLTQQKEANHYMVETENTKEYKAGGIRVFIHSLSRDSIVPSATPNYWQYVRLFTFTRLVKGQQYLEVYHMEEDTDRMREEALRHRTHIYPPTTTIPTPGTNLLIGNFDPCFEGDALVLDAFDISTLFTKGIILSKLSVEDLLDFLARKYFEKKTQLAAVKVALLNENQRAKHESESRTASKCDRLARDLLYGDSTVAELRIFINAIAWGKGRHCSGKFSPRDWTAWAASQFTNPNARNLCTVDMTRIVPRGTPPGMIYQLGGFENLLVDPASINYLQRITPVGQDGLLHMGSVHQMATDPYDIDYQNRDDIHGLAILHFTPTLGWGADINKAYPDKDSFDHRYNTSNDAPASPLPVSEAELEDESYSSKDLRARGSHRGNEVIVQVYVGKRSQFGDPLHISNLSPLNRYSKEGRLELINNDIEDWYTYLIDHNSLEEASEFIEFFNHPDRSGVFTAMFAHLFFSDWHVPIDSLGYTYNIVCTKSEVNPGSLLSLLDDAQASLTGPQTVRVWTPMPHDEVLKLLIERNESPFEGKTEAAYVSLNSSKGDYWLVDRKLGKEPRNWTVGHDSFATKMRQKRIRDAEIGSSESPPVPCVLANVPRSIARFDVLRAISFFGGGSHTLADTAVYGTSVKERPLIIVSGLPYADLTEHTFATSSENAPAFTFHAVPFDPTLHVSTGISLATGNLVATERTHIAHLKQTFPKRDGPPTRFAKGITASIAIRKKHVRPEILKNSGRPSPKRSKSNRNSESLGVIEESGQEEGLGFDDEGKHDFLNDDELPQSHHPTLTPAKTAQPPSTCSTPSSACMPLSNTFGSLSTINSAEEEDECRELEQTELEILRKKKQRKYQKKKNQKAKKAQKEKDKKEREERDAFEQMLAEEDSGEGEDSPATDLTKRVEAGPTETPLNTPSNAPPPPELRSTNCLSPSTTSKNTPKRLQFGDDVTSSRSTGNSNNHTNIEERNCVVTACLAEQTENLVPCKKCKGKVCPACRIEHKEGDYTCADCSGFRKFSQSRELQNQPSPTTPQRKENPDFVILETTKKPALSSQLTPTKQPTISTHFTRPETDDSSADEGDESSTQGG